jgi:N-acyl-D-aspartate/D-glutamate deacylase
LLAEVAGLKDRGLTAEGVVIDVVFKNIQPLKDRVHPAYLYTGVRDPSRVINMHISEENVLNWVVMMLRGVVVNVELLGLILLGIFLRW